MATTTSFHSPTRLLDRALSGRAHVVGNRFRVARGVIVGHRGFPRQAAGGLRGRRRRFLGGLAGLMVGSRTDDTQMQATGVSSGDDQQDTRSFVWCSGTC
jgi:hypothetical protein